MQLRPVVLVALMPFVALAPLVARSDESVRADGSARALLDSAYGAYVGADARGVRLDGPRDLRRWFAPPLVRLIERDRRRSARRNEVGRLDGDPLVDAQDWQLSDLRITVLDEQSARAHARVSFVNAGEPVSLDVELVRLREGWRIADVRGRDGSLRARLSGAP